MDYVANKDIIAKRIARIFKTGDVVNLGIGLPTLVANYVPEDVTIILQSENGMMGLGPAAAKGEEDWDLINAGSAPVTILPGGCYFDSATSFGIIRGGHVDYTVLGVLEVDQEGNLANYKIPGKMVPGMGGAMDLTTGARVVIAATLHFEPSGTSQRRTALSVKFRSLQTWPTLRPCSRTILTTCSLKAASKALRGFLSVMLVCTQGCQGTPYRGVQNY